MSEHVLTDEDAKTYLDIGIKATEVVLLRWPDATPDFADFVLWELTPWPVVSGVHDLADAIAEAPDPESGDRP